VALVVFGSLIGEFAGVHGWLGGLGGLVGDQGFEYLDLGRLWQVLLVIGLFFWVAILWRGLRGRLSREHVGNMPWLFFFAALAIPAFYAVGLLAKAGTPSPSPTSGASGSSTYGSRTSSSCSPR
jgi:nitric oxide reductase subunit B